MMMRFQTKRNQQLDPDVGSTGKGHTKLNVWFRRRMAAHSGEAQQRVVLMNQEPSSPIEPASRNHTSQSSEPEWTPCWSIVYDWHLCLFLPVFLLPRAGLTLLQSLMTMTQRVLGQAWITRSLVSAIRHWQWVLDDRSLVTLTWHRCLPDGLTNWTGLFRIPAANLA